MYNNQDALGFVETCGLAAAIEVADAMVKTANVTIEAAHMVDAGLVCVICSGDVAACKAAVDAGMATAVRMGTPALCNVIARPAYEQGDMGILGPLSKINAKRAAKKAARQARLLQSAKTAQRDSETEQKAAKTPAVGKESSSLPTESTALPAEPAALPAEPVTLPTESDAHVPPAQAARADKAGAGGADKTEKPKKAGNKAKKK